MIYINNELLSLTDPKHKEYQDMFLEFKTTYAQNFSKEGKMVKPLSIRYRDDLVKPDTRNRGLKIQPKSMGLSFTSRMYNKSGQHIEVKYSATPAIPDPKTGALVFRESFAEVRDGRLSISDSDLAFYFEKFSSQNASNPMNQGKPNTWFVVDDPIAERAKAAKVKQRQALYESKLWNEPEHGGLGEKKLRIIGTELMILNADSLEVNELRESIDRIMNLSPQLVDEFLSRVEGNDVSAEEEHERMMLVAKAIEKKLFSINTINRTFHRHDPETKKQIKKPIFTYPRTEKNPRLAFYYFLEAEEPETISTLKESMALLTEV